MKNYLLFVMMLLCSSCLLAAGDPVADRDAAVDAIWGPRRPVTEEDIQRLFEEQKDIIELSRIRVAMFEGKHVDIPERFREQFKWDAGE